MSSCTKSVFIMCIFVLTILFASWSFLKGEGVADVGTLLILGLTLIAVIYYVFSTHEILEVNKKTYADSKLPVVCLSIKQNEENIYDTRVILTNVSNYNLQAFVNLNLRVNGQLVEHTPDYSGKEPWIYDIKTQ